MKKRKLLQKLLSGSKNISFSDAVAGAEVFGFRLDRINGSHHIFEHPEVPGLLNLQDVKGKAKSYQVKQLLCLIERYNLQMGDEA
jgi:predicted RNA binding protein YcfA (HicA-like mRNA interferase family)